MTLRFSTSRAIGAALVLTLGSVASAQQPLPVRKDTPRPSQTPMPVTKDTPARRDTTTMPAPTPTPLPAATPMPTATMDSSTTTTTTTTTTTSTGEVPPAMPSLRMRNGWYIGVAGAAELPQNALNDAYRSGWGVEVPIGWDPVNSPLGLRLNLGYSTLRSESQFSTRLSDPQIYQAVGDAKLRLPFGKGLLSGLYAVGGGGVYYFRNYTNTIGLVAGQTSQPNVTGTLNAEDRTQFGLNAGGGIQFGLGNAAMYLESRYVRIFTPNRNSDMVPVALGVTFNW